MQFYIPLLRRSENIYLWASFILFKQLIVDKLKRNGRINDAIKE